MQQQKHGRADGDGIKEVYIKFKDAVENESLIYSSSVILDTQINLILKETVDEESTDFSITTEGKRLTYNRRPTFSGIGEVGATVTITINSDPINGSTTVDSNGNWSWTPEKDIPIGEHSVTITLQDLAGNTQQVGYVLGILEARLAQTGSPIVGLMVIGITTMIGSLGIIEKKHW